MSKYICSVPYSDGYANYKIGDEIEVERLSFSNGTTWVYPAGDHPLSLEAFKFCFEELEL